MSGRALLVGIIGNKCQVVVLCMNSQIRTRYGLQKDGIGFLAVFRKNILLPAKNSNEKKLSRKKQSKVSKFY